MAKSTAVCLVLCVRCLGGGVLRLAYVLWLFEPPQTSDIIINKQ